MTINPLGRAFALVGLAALAVLANACTTDENSGSSQDSAIPNLDGGGKHDLSFFGDIGPSTDLACTPEVTSCSGLCGPVRDDCTGQTFQCGGCTNGTVCDLDSHTCVTPEDTCAELGRVCGSTKNSCGQTITCSPFYCPANEECNPDSNLCQACEQVTCEDLGYQCGPAWLGCGSNTNTVDCGACPTNQVCNDALHICEPQNGGTCTLPAGSVSNADQCAAAAMSDGVECGPISNGCGGIIDCTTDVPSSPYVCPTGETCGGAGIPNHCDPAEPPTECIAAGFNCGNLTSACGGTVSCGDCTLPETCLPAPGSTAGVCGILCNMPMKTCPVDYADQCGTGLDNNCYPTKLDCACASGTYCSSTTPGVPGTCSNDAACMQFQTMGGKAGDVCSNAPSTAFPKGDGTYLECQCNNPGTGSGQESCIVPSGQTEGTCCQHPTCDGIHTSLPDPCGGTLTCACAQGQVAYNGECCTPESTATLCEQGANQGNYTMPTNNCGQQVTCNCNRYTLDNPSAGVGNACCPLPAACPSGQCSGNGPVSACSGKSATCNAACAKGQECNGSNACCNPMTCPNDGAYHVYTDDGCGHQLTCGCPSGTVIPRNSSGAPVNGATCCTAPSACPSNTCNTTEEANCMGQSGVDNGKSGTITCKCGTGQCCDTTSNTCDTSTTCGDTCGGTVTNCGVVTTCSCSGGDVCTSGACTCPAATCNGCVNDTQSNSCGNSVSGCGCTGGKTCGSDGQTCCVQETCPGGLPQGHECGPFTDSCTGKVFSCGCPQTTPNAICNGSTFQCDCTPTKCCSDTGGVTPCLQPGPYSNDGCGNAGTCAT